MCVSCHYGPFLLWNAIPERVPKMNSPITLIETLIFYNLYILQIYLENLKSFKSKNTIFVVYIFFFKSCLCSYINLEFLQFHFISAKICIHFADLLIQYKIFFIKNYKFLFSNFFKSRLRQFLFISAKIYI